MGTSEVHVKPLYSEYSGKETHYRELSTVERPESYLEELQISDPWFAGVGSKFNPL